MFELVWSTAITRIKTYGLRAETTEKAGGKMKALDSMVHCRLNWEDLPEPKLQDGEVLVKVKAVGICGSDIPWLPREDEEANSADGHGPMKLQGKSPPQDPGPGSSPSVKRSSSSPSRGAGTV